MMLGLIELAKITLKLTNFKAGFRDRQAEICVGKRSGARYA